jgi:nucleoside-diphosphate-sugar epimerase
VFVAGGTGVIGRSLVPQLVKAGHQVAATTRLEAKRGMLRSLGATPVVLDPLDAASVMAAVRDFGPEALMNQLTSLPPRYEPRKLEPWYRRTAKLRVDGTKHLLAAAHEVGSRRFIYQSIAFMYAPVGPSVVDEDAPLMLDAPPPFNLAVGPTLEGEGLALSAEGVIGVVLRYGQLYGPGTYFADKGDFVRQARLRMLPVVGSGLGTFSFVHVDDAAAAAVSAVGRGRGVYNIVDDDPALIRDWIPAFCAEVGAPRPMHVPTWAAVLLAGRMAAFFENARGATNVKAKRELGWTPSRPSWRAGFLKASSSPIGSGNGESVR